MVQDQGQTADPTTTMTGTRDLLLESKKVLKHLDFPVIGSKAHWSKSLLNLGLWTSLLFRSNCQVLVGLLAFILSIVWPRRHQIYSWVQNSASTLRKYSNLQSQPQVTATKYLSKYSNKKFEYVLKLFAILLYFSQVHTQEIYIFLIWSLMYLFIF